MIYRTSEKGFSALELTVAVTVMALIMVSVIGSVSRMAPYWRTEQIANDVSSTLHAARSRALTDGKDMTIVFDVPRDRFTVLENLAPMSVEVETVGGKQRRVVELPYGVHFTDPDNSTTVTCSPPDMYGDTAVGFNSSGRLRSTSTPCYVYVGHPSTSYYRRIQVNVVGTLMVQKWNGSSWQ